MKEFQINVSTLRKLALGHKAERPTRDDDLDVLGKNDTCDACTTDDLEPSCRGLCFQG